MINKFDAPHQPQSNDNEQSIIVLNSNNNFEDALLDLNSFSHVWVVSFFHKNKNWKPKVLPPRGSSKKRGVFATRSPRRPNPIGISLVKLVKIEELKIYIGSNDLIDGTPILDIKPYIPKIDIINSATNGWVDEIESEINSKEKFEIKFSILANDQLKWFEKFNINFIDRAKELLSIDPSPHRTRRIKKFNDKFIMGCGGWRIIFSTTGNQVIIENFISGYPLKSLTDERKDRLINFDAHKEFYRVWVTLYRDE